ncbi:hypothetical protein [Vibrio phage vB_VpM-pA2SJ1]|uniref:Uncharacterized protein n=1 Tax=Vibrio phage vB_VpM-pA2SJ1 TaxID=3095964 RepID=A0AAX4J5T2_9CAUD
MITVEVAEILADAITDGSTYIAFGIFFGLLFTK